MATPAAAVLPALWLGLGLEAPRVDPLAGGLYGGTVGLGADLGPILWVELRGGAVPQSAPQPTGTDRLLEQWQWNARWDHHDRAGWGEARVGFAPIRGELGAHGAGVALALGVFVGDLRRGLRSQLDPRGAAYDPRAAE
ncbi:hypothetical protein LBMAG42_54370 [Deltaproteobacteria bacterium]|nr:hypothetical protein LBMAG42_54370 [Deltaproteobacteria bacterium]